MKHRVIALGAACLTCLVSLAPASAGAQGMRVPAAPDSNQGLQQRGLAQPAQPATKAARSVRPAKPGSSNAPARLEAPSAAPSAVVPAAAPASAPGAPAPTRAGDYIVAIVNSEPVTNHEVQVRAERIAQQLAQQGGAQPPRAALLREVLERTILDKAQLQAAKELGIKVDDLAVAQAERGVAQQNNVSEAEMQRRLAADGITPERFREELHNQLLLQRLREREVDSRVKVSELDVDRYLREPRSPTASGAAANATAVNLGQVLVAVPEKASPAEVARLQARAQGVADQARAGADFAALAREFSQAPEAAAGGAMGLRPLSRYPELFAQAVQSLQVGAVAGPLRSGAGFHVLKVLDKPSAGVASTAIKTRARHILLTTGPQLSETAAAAQLADYRRRILAGQADFAALAREHSKDGSAKDGGDLGWATPGRYVPEFEQALEALKPGEISEPLVSRFGVHLVQLQERAEQELTGPEQRAMARDALREKKTEEAYDNWVRELRARAYVEYRDPPQ